MSEHKFFETFIDDGLHLDVSRDTPGAVRGTLRDSDNNLVGHANFREVDLDSDEDEQVVDYHDRPDLGLSSPAILAALGVGAAVAGAVGLTAYFVSSRRDRSAQAKTVEESQCLRQQAPPVPTAPAAGWYDDGTGSVRWWNGQNWTEHLKPSPSSMSATSGARPSNAGSPWRESQPHGDRDAHRSSRQLPAETMSSIEWLNRLRQMVLARTYNELEWNVLTHAHIVDATNDILGSQFELRRMTLQQFSEAALQLVSQNPRLLDDTAPACVPGWYIDHNGTRRWWDGHNWTEFVQQPPAVAFNVRTAQQTAGWYDDGSGRLRWWTGHVWTAYRN